MEPKQLGPIGGEGGRPFDGYTIPDDARLTAVHVFAEWVLDALRLEWVDSNGAPGSHPPIGGLGGYHHTFYLDEDEYLTGISGRCGWYVDSVRFHTNKRVSDLFGGEGGEREYTLLASPGEEVAGLFGRCDWYIDALGLQLRPLAVREEAAEGAALEAEAEAERLAEAAEEELDEALVDAAAMAMEGEDVLRASIAHRSEALTWLRSDPEAMEAEATPAPAEADALADLVAALEEEIDAEQQERAAEEALDMAAGRVADFPPVEASLLEWTGEEGEPLDAVVAVRRADVASELEVEALEEAAIAEAIAVLHEGHGGEGTVDLAVYTQVDESDEGDVATVLAVAAPASGEEPPAGESETAIMVVDAIASEDELLELEQAAVEGALLALEEDLGEAIDDADVAIYMGMTEDETGQPYGAVVVVASRSPVAPAATMRSATERGSFSDKVMQFGGLEPRPQDLQLVEGIGPKIAALLIENGVNDLGQLAETPVERLREVLAGAGRRFRLADPATWPRQAHLAATGQWAELTQLQTELKAGREER
ncbi:MAG TPA: jacalin-like lectin [Promineifilum sp.]|nr:jacalin-like lectin [Promineifilum sp.]